MAEKKTYADVLSGGKIGTYKESTGGGTPLEAGEKLKDHPEAHRVQQPRDEEGKFTYNSANAKPLKYGPSRGTTIPPFLKDVKMKYAAKSGDRIVTNDGGKNLVYLNNLNFTVDSLINTFKQYFNSSGFGQFSSEIKKKRGAVSKAEKAASSVSILDPQSAQQALQKVQQMYKGKTPKGFTPIPNTPNTQPSQPTPQQPGGGQGNTNSFIKPQQPKPQPTQTQEVKKFDIQQAKDNPQQFMKDNYAEIQKIEQIVTNKGYDLDVDELVKAIASGQFKDFDDIINQIS